MQVTLLASEGLLPAAVVSTTGGPVARMAIDFSKLPGPFAVLRQTIASTGIRGLWLGHSGTLLRETGGSSAWFSAFEVVSRAFMRAKEKKLGLQRGEVTKADLRAWELCVSGGAAGMAYNRERAVPRPLRSVSRSVELTRRSLSLSLLSCSRSLPSRHHQIRYADPCRTAARSRRSRLIPSSRPRDLCCTWLQGPLRRVRSSHLHDPERREGGAR